MDYNRYELRQVNHHEFELLLYLNDQDMEFAEELGRFPSKTKDVLTSAKDIIKKQYPHVKVTLVKVILGGIVVSSLSLGMNVGGEAAAAGLDTEQLQSTDSIYHTVKSGDSLWTISQKYNTSVDHIKQANGLTSNVIQLNQKLIIPKAIHVVKTGDYLTVLAKHYGVTVDAIKEANNLSTDATFLGQSLIIPTVIGSSVQGQPVKSISQTESKSQTTNYTVVSGDSLSVIAKRFGVSVEQLKTANSLTTDVIRVGQVLTIPGTAGGTGQTSTQTGPQEQAGQTSTQTGTQEQAAQPASQQSSYTVVSGDSLSVIAKRFGTTVEQIKNVNNLSSDVIRVGQVLEIPASGGSEVQKPETLETSYTVVAGDSLWTISQKLGTTVHAIKTSNKLTSDTLSIGQVLKIPTTSTGTVVTNPTENSVQAPPPEPVQKPAIETNQERSTFDYSVQSGDSLSVIANKFGVTMDAIRQANSLKTDSLRIGQALTIPNGITPTINEGINTITYTTHTVQSGDNIWDLSIKYGIPQNEILKANNLSTSSTLSIGQKLKIPVHHIGYKQVSGEKYGEYLDWWTEAQYIFTIGTKAKVTDLQTGKSFYIQRTVGANHADSETVTLSDTNIAKSIWGGYSWSPRAVVLEIDGRKVAASMSFMPHEREYISGNGITGHFDVYFGNSTRHKDGLADPSHQAQVEKAAGMR